MRWASPPGSFVQGLLCHLAVSLSICKTPSGTRLCALAQALPSLGQRLCVLSVEEKRQSPLWKLH